MDTLTTGIVIYLAAMLGVGAVMALTIRKAQSEGVQGAALIRKLAPHLVADMLFTIIFVMWFLRQQG